MASVGESVSTNKRKGDGQRELQDYKKSRVKLKKSCIAARTSKIILSYIEAIKGLNTLNVILAE